MARVLGIGGIFFKCGDPAALMKWYSEVLGVAVHAHFNGAIFRAADFPQGGYTVLSAFDAHSEHFAPSSASFMINFMVDDVDGVIDAVIRSGGKQVGDIEDHPQGRFGWCVDPAGNKIELWRPAPDSSN